MQSEAEANCHYLCRYMSNILESIRLLWEKQTKQTTKAQYNSDNFQQVASSGKTLKRILQVYKKLNFNLQILTLENQQMRACACTHTHTCKVNKRNSLSLLPSVFASYLGPEPGKCCIMSCRDESSSPGSRRQTSLHSEVFLAWAIFFLISADKTGADPADGCDKIKPPPRGMNAQAHTDGCLWLFTMTNYAWFRTAIHFHHYCCERFDFPVHLFFLFLFLI